jgi:hypothetical protein
MTKLRFTMQTLALSVFMLAFASLANAQASRTWVSGVGDDVNPCSRTAPCKTWAGAISKTARGGEIDALDPGGYGTLTITKSITVDGTTGQGFGSTLNSGGINGFVINDSLSATPNTAKVTLRNISINGAGTTAGLNGIRFLAGKELSLDNVTIENQSSHGVDMQLGVVAHLRLHNVRIENCGGNGVNVRGTTVNAQFVSIYGSSFFRNNVGVHADDSSRVTIKDSVADGNITTGFSVNAATAGRPGEMNVIDSVSANHIQTASSRGLLAGGAAGGGTMRIGGNAIHTNNVAFNQGANGTIITYDNNQIDGNGPGVGVLTAAPSGLQ